MPAQVRRRRRIAGRPRGPRDGRELENQPAGFPLFFARRQPRVVTADPWAYLVHLARKTLGQEQAPVAVAYIEQALDFFQAAQNPRLGSKPLLYYYSFLNLTKAALLIRGVRLPPAARHGVHDPRENTRERLRLAGQHVSVPNPAPNHADIFPELLVQLEAPHVCDGSWRIIDLLGQIPSVHRTYTRVSGKDPQFFPIKDFVVMGDRDELWVRMIANRKDRDVVRTRGALQRRRAFNRVFSMVASANDDQIWYESTSVRRTRALDRSISELAATVRSVGVSSILTSVGYRHYAALVPPANFVPQIAASYAVAFYFGSVTRYKPQDFDKIVGSGYHWLVEEFLATAPHQFIYTIASWLAGVEVVKPFAALS